MQRITNKYQYIFLLLIVLLAYTPVLGFLFALKNDAFTGYFPPKMFFGDVLKQGHIPLWNPNLNFGFPIYGDMSMAWWNPITWLIGGLAGYNVYSFTLEEVFYIVLASISFFTLTSYWKWHPTAKVNAGLSYACGGYFIGHLQHFNWLSGMAFFPFVLFFYLKNTEQSSVKNYSGLALSSYFFFTSAHPGLIIGGIYFLLFFFIPDFFKHIKNGNRSLIHFSSVHIISFLVLAATVAGPVYAFLEVIPHTTRGSKIDAAISLMHPTTFQSWLSVTLPFATVKNDAFFLTDIAMRNCYMGLTTLIFFIAAFRKKIWTNNGQWLCIILFFGLLSAGGLFGEFCNRFLPLIGYVRLSGEFTIFALIAIIVIAGQEFNKYLPAPKSSRLNKIILWLAAILAIVIFVAALNIVINHNSIIFSDAFPNTGLISNLKWTIDHVSFGDTIVLQGCVQFIILISIKKIVQRRNDLLRWLIAADLIFASLLNIPFTGVGKMSPAQVQHLIDGAKADAFIAIKQTDTFNLKKNIGDLQWYNKTPGNKEVISYPMILSAAEKYFESPRKNANDQLPYVFMDSGHLKNLNYSNDKIQFDLNITAPNRVTLQQINYPGWQIISNSGPLALADHPDQLVSFEVSPSTTSAEIYFTNPAIRFLVYYSTIVLILLFSLFIFSNQNSRGPTA